ncbi:nacht and wd40 domain-containing protein [Moniliophthora roreri MCA 2997]|uniref:Nacht and wd40 domain-containing protein n=1 Tax=Moniliophthora roreri (strain MCA 2997) TaxID=1381753 RepID=V2XCS0_MONRO|nr:nacht and wd40 domain-containing protein [Moniliophthora roreri MCA 2997]
MGAYTTIEPFKLFALNAAPNACYDSEQRFPPPNCHPGTRTQILEELSQWIEDDQKTTRVFWVHGSVGVGKSAIAQNLAENRDKLEPFVASIAYQFITPGSRLGSVLGPTIIETISSDLNLFHASFESQFQRLIIRPCSKVKVTNLDDLPNTIIIDGLDEYLDHSSQERLLRIIEVTAALHIPEFPVPWIFLIFSRPEPHTRDAFGDFGTILKCLDVNSSDEAHRDIHKYFVDQFTVLRRKHHRTLRYEGTSWPSADAICQPAKRADKQFIFASTVTKYIDTRGERPQDRLDTVLRIYVDRGADSPYSDSDLLYRQILSTCHKWESVQPILRLLVTHGRPWTMLGYNFNYSDESIHWRSSETIALFLNLKMGVVEAILSSLHSVLQMPRDDDFDSDIYITHASFTEFLSDPNRSGEYYTPEMPESEYFDFIAT